MQYPAAFAHPRTGDNDKRSGFAVERFWFRGGLNIFQIVEIKRRFSVVAEFFREIIILRCFNAFSYHLCALIVSFWYD